MATVDPVNLAFLLDDAKCFALVRQHRWPEGVRCPGCGSDAVVRNGHDDTQPHRQRYRCQACASRFDDLSGTVLAGHHQELSPNFGDGLRVQATAVWDWEDAGLVATSIPSVN